MKELPILFSTDMVQAILSDRKAQTRRVIKGIPENATDELLQIMVSGHHTDYGHIICPYGKIGDKLWVRETWQYNYNMVNETMLHEPTLNNIVFKADNPQTSLMLSEVWKPSIHMRKQHARIWLEVTGVRVERLTTISELDAMKEGLKVVNRNGRVGDDLFLDYNNPYMGGYLSAYYSFKSLWEKINGRDTFETNPWVWVIDFKVLSATGRPA